MPKGILSILGFLFLLFGFLTIILGMIGLQIKFLSFIDQMGPLGSFLVKVLMIIIGIILMYFDQTRSLEEE